MKYYEPLYIDVSFKNVSMMKQRIRFSKIPLLNYVIVLSQNSGDQLEIIQGSVLRQRYYPKKSLFVVGISKDYNGAINLVMKIVEDTYRNTGGYDIKAFLSR